VTSVHENRLIEKDCDVITTKHNHVVRAAIIARFVGELVLSTAWNSVISVLISCFVCYDRYIVHKLFVKYDLMLCVCTDAAILDWKLIFSFMNFLHHFRKYWGRVGRVLSNEHQLYGVPPSHHTYKVNSLLVTNVTKIALLYGIVEETDFEETWQMSTWYVHLPEQLKEITCSERDTILM